MKVKIGKIEYEFKHVTLAEDHGMDEDALSLLMKLDEALAKSKEGITEKKDLDAMKVELETKINEIKADFNFGKFQEQLNAIFVKLEDSGIRPLASKEENERKERHLNSQWIKSLMKKDKTGLDKYYKEAKLLSPIMHLGPVTDEIAEDFTQGGYLVPELLTSEINRFAVEGGIARREMRYLPFDGPGNTRTLHSLLTSVVISWIDEGEAKPKTKPTTTTVSQTLKEMAAMVIFTEQLLEDASIDWVAYCSPLLGEAIAKEEDDQFFNGVGTPWTGILQDPLITSLALAPSIGPLSMRPEALMALPLAIPSTAVPGAKFYMHRSVFAAISIRRSDAVAEGDTKGNYLIQQPSQGAPGSIWGYPVVLTESLPSLSDLYASEDLDFDGTCDPDEPLLFFGNLGKCCVYGDKKGLRLKTLDQASVYDSNDNLINLAERNMIALRCHKRVGYATVLPEGISILQTGPIS